MLGRKLKEKIAIKRPANTPNGSGGFETTLSTVVSTYAKVRHLSVSNDVIAQQSNLVEAYEFTIRYRQDIEIKIADVIEWRGRTFEIIGLPPGFINKKEIKIKATTRNETTDNGEV